MPASLLTLCENARRGPDVPADVLRLAAVQHVSAAAVVRQVRPTAEGAALLERQGDREEQLRSFSGLLTSFFQDDHVSGGLYTAPMLALGWLLAKKQGRSAEALIEATAVGTEVGARVGLALGRASPAEVDSRPAAAAAAAAGAWLSGMDAVGIASAVVLAVQAAPVMGLPEVARAPADLAALPAIAALRALGGGVGATELEFQPRPGWGQVWLGRSLVVKAGAGRQVGRVAAEAVEEILKRHLKAADKRLRTDQVEKIEIRVDLSCLLAEEAVDALGVSAPVGLSLKQRLGALVVRHCLEPAVLTAPALAEKRAEIDVVASRVVLKGGWVQSVRGANARLAAGAGHRGLRGLWPLIGKLERPPLDQLGELAEARPDRLLKELLIPGDHQKTIEKPSWEEPVEVKLYTNRGGWWPERRSLPTGVGAAAEELALRRFGPEAAPLLVPMGSAEQWCRELGL